MLRAVIYFCYTVQIKAKENKSYKYNVPLVCILNGGTVPPGCILNGRTDPHGCILNGGTVYPGYILNGGTVPPFNLFLFINDTLILIIVISGIVLYRKVNN